MARDFLTDIDRSNFMNYRASKCEMCQKPLPKRHVVHKNISQTPMEHKFCSRECKAKWCNEKNKD